MWTLHLLPRAWCGSRLPSTRRPSLQRARGAWLRRARVLGRAGLGPAGGAGPTAAAQALPAARLHAPAAPAAAGLGRTTWSIPASWLRLSHPPPAQGLLRGPAVAWNSTRRPYSLSRPPSAGQVLAPGSDQLPSLKWPGRSPASPADSGLCRLRPAWTSSTAFQRRLLGGLRQP